MKKLIYVRDLGIWVASLYVWVVCILYFFALSAEWQRDNTAHIGYWSAVKFLTGEGPTGDGETDGSLFFLTSIMLTLYLLSSILVVVLFAHSFNTLKKIFGND